MSWRDDKITDKQRDFIEAITESINCESFDFDHATKGTACDFISRHIDDYKFSTELENWASNPNEHYFEYENYYHF